MGKFVIRESWVFFSGAHTRSHHHSLWISQAFDTVVPSHPLHCGCTMWWSAGVPHSLCRPSSPAVPPRLLPQDASILHSREGRNRQLRTTRRMRRPSTMCVEVTGLNSARRIEGPTWVSVIYHRHLLAWSLLIFKSKSHQFSGKALFSWLGIFLSTLSPPH
jgi:hypothetical protein